MTCFPKSSSFVLPFFLKHLEPLSSHCFFQGLFRRQPGRVKVTNVNNKKREMLQMLVNSRLEAAAGTPMYCKVQVIVPSASCYNCINAFPIPFTTCFLICGNRTLVSCGSTLKEVIYSCACQNIIYLPLGGAASSLLIYCKCTTVPMIALDNSDVSA